MSENMPDNKESVPSLHLNADTTTITVAQLCEVIDLLHPCMDDFLYIYDFQNDFYYISPNAVERFLLTENSFHNVSENLATFTYPPDLEALQNDLEQLISGEKDFHNLQYRWLDAQGQPVWINCCGYVVRENDTSAYMLGCVNEIGIRQKADNISGLLGETSLQTYFKELSLLFPKGYILRLGLDDFREVNENFGIEYGDMVLRKIAAYISECLLPGQQLYRIVSDEFLILDFLDGSEADALNLYKRIRHSLDSFVKENLYEAVVTISGGLLNINKIQDFSYSNVMKISEFALNEAKHNGKNQCYLFSLEDYDLFLHKKKLTQILRQAVTHDFEGFEIYFQPVFFANSNRLYGAESLMRFRCEELGIVSPAEFVPILEETSLIIPTGHWILHQALQQTQKIQQYIPNFRISINVSYIQILKSDILDEIISAVKHYKLTPSTVVVELTESGLLLSDTRFSKLWKRLKENDILLALDDFGTGYSNFHYLYELRPDIIKIDRSFTAKSMENDYEYNLLSLISNMIHSLNLKVCVEGIETEQELNRMKEVAPDLIQGFYFGSPCPYQEFAESFVRKQPSI